MKSLVEILNERYGGSGDIQNRIETDIQMNDYKNKKDLFNAVDRIIYEEIFDNLDDRLYSFNKRLASRGTWKITLCVNDYHFGSEIAERLNNLSIITHDEDKEGSLEDFEEAIYDEIQDWADDYWNDEPWKD